RSVSVVEDSVITPGTVGKRDFHSKRAPGPCVKNSHFPSGPARQETKSNTLIDRLYSVRYSGARRLMTPELRGGRIMPVPYRFSFGPWNLSEGADPFGPPVRDPMAFAEKLKIATQLGFQAMQFHDDDAVPNLDSLPPSQVAARAREMKKLLSDHGLVAEFVAPRLWENPRTIDGAYTSNDPAERGYAVERTIKAVDIANELDCHLMVLWLAREGTYIREAKSV